MRNVPPESQIIPLVCEPPTVTSALNVVAGKSVVISRVASRSIAAKSRSDPGARYAGALSQAIGPWSNIGQSSLGGLCGARAYGFNCGDIGQLFRRAGK